MFYRVKTKISFISLSLSFAVIFSILSQVRTFESILRPFMYLNWSILGIMGMVLKKGKMNYSKFFKVFLFTYLLGVFINLINIILQSGYSFSNYISVMIIPIFVYFISYTLGNIIDIRKMNQILFIYEMCCIIFAIWLHLSQFTSISGWMTQFSYVYGSGKNSAGLLLTSAALAFIFYENSDKKFIRALQLLASSYLIFIVALLQCRAALTCFSIVLFLYIFMQSRHKFLLFAILGSIVLIFILNERLYLFIDHVFLFSKYSGTNLDTFSSGRLTLYTKAFQEFLSSPLWGVGAHYVDNFYLCILTEMGILGGAAVIYCLYYRIKINFDYCRFRQDKSQRIKLFLFYLSLLYILESLFEAFPPFGPGVSCFLFWLLCGWIDRNANTNNITI